MTNRKGQSALEYLMTYGWAILIIIIVGGVLYYYGVFSPAKLVGESKVGFSRVQIDSWGVSGGNLTLMFENRVGKDINILQIYIDGANSTPNFSTNMKAGARSDIWTSTEIPTASAVSAGEAYQMEVSIEYEYEDVGGRFNSSGSLSGTA